jgi:hypothetical protein
MNEELKCQKCGYISKENKKRFGIEFCSVCMKFAPNSPEKIDEYITTKIPWRELNPFRKFSSFVCENQKQGMIIKASQGKPMSRPPFGYEFQNQQLIPSKDSKKVEEIFQDFLNSLSSLNQLSKKWGFSINGLKKILFNFTYIGKIKFDGQIHSGNHIPLVSSILFNQVQEKLDSLNIKKP